MDINPVYKTEESLLQIKKIWQEKHSIMLANFFTEASYKKKEKEMKNAVYKRDCMPDQYSYATKKEKEFERNKELLQFLAQVLQKKTVRIVGEMVQFSWKDYTTLHDKNKEKPGIDIIIDLTPEWDDSYGGAVVYSDGKGGYTKVFTQKNSLLLVRREQGIQRYVQYVNNLSRGKKRYLFIGKVQA